MEKQFFVESNKLSSKALEKKRRLENEPSYRKNHMEYLPGMEEIKSDICQKVITQMELVLSKILKLCFLRRQSLFWSRWRKELMQKRQNGLEIRYTFLLRYT